MMRVDIPVLLLILGVRPFGVEQDVSCGFFIDVLYHIGENPFYSLFVQCFILLLLFCFVLFFPAYFVFLMKGFWILSNDVPASIEMIMWFCILF